MYSVLHLHMFCQLYRINFYTIIHLILHSVRKSFHNPRRQNKHVNKNTITLAQLYKFCADRTQKNNLIKTLIRLLGLSNTLQFGYSLSEWHRLASSINKNGDGRFILNDVQMQLELFWDDDAQWFGVRCLK